LFVATLLAICLSGCAKKYTATAHIRIARTAPGAQSIALVQNEYGQLIREQAILAKSDIVLKDAADMPGISFLPSIKGEIDRGGSPMKFLQDRLTVSVSETDESMRINVDVGDEDESILIIRSISEAYLTHAGRLERSKNLLEEGKILREMNGIAREIKHFKDLREQLQRDSAVADASRIADSEEIVKSKQIEFEKLSSQGRRIEAQLRAPDRYSLLSITIRDSSTGEEREVWTDEC
jgi:hypothetical protein